MTRTLLAVVLVSFTLQTPATDARGRLDAFLRGRVSAGDVPAVVAIVVDRHATLYTGAFGQANVALNRPVAVDSIFRIASMTKPVTSLAAMMLYDEGRLRLDDPVAKYLPEFSKLRVITAWNEGTRSYDSRPPLRQITVRDLLTHTSGLAYSFEDARLAKLDDGRATEMDLPLLHDPGKAFTYGPSTAVLGRIVERICGEALDAVFKTRIFDPLQMRDTFFAVPAGKRERVVTLHARAADGTLQESANPAALSAPARGDGGLFSTAADYARFMQVFLHGGRAGDVRLVKEDTVRMMTSNQIGSLTIREQPSVTPALLKPFPIGAGKDAFGFGFAIAGSPAEPGLRSAGSLSWGGIFNTHFWIDPRRSIAAAVLMQVLPYYDPKALAVLRGFEREVYATLDH